MVVALFLRGLVPVGYMPNPASGEPGAGAIMLCDSVHDLLSVMTDPMMADPALAKPGMIQAMMADPWMHHHHEGGGHAGHTVDAPCVFAAVAALAAVLLAVILILSPEYRAVRWTPAPAAPRRYLRPPGTRLARGPPSLLLS
ncbi:MAG: hypothetical protein PW843_10945 [Azospirillaceae bacterium]|nr:hypothetical protein [Azospirillaceae bacterium]